MNLILWEFVSSFKMFNNYCIISNGISYFIFARGKWVSKVVRELDQYVYKYLWKVFAEWNYVRLIAVTAELSFIILFGMLFVICLDIQMYCQSS